MIERRFHNAKKKKKTRYSFTYLDLEAVEIDRVPLCWTGM